MEKVVGEQCVALQQHFPYKSSKFSENSNCHINLLLNSRGLKLGHFDIFDVFFSFLAFFNHAFPDRLIHGLPPPKKKHSQSTSPIKKSRVGQWKCAAGVHNPEV